MPSGMRQPIDILYW